MLNGRKLKDDTALKEGTHLLIRLILVFVGRGL